MIRILLIALVCLVGCETVGDTLDAWFTRGPEGQASDAENVTNTVGGVLIPSPYRELIVGVVGAVAGFWTSRKATQKKK